MGVALENARLFDETQRLLQETERRERESTALSEVGRDLSSTLDLATVMDRIAAHAKELLAAQNSAIFLPDADGQRYRAIVALGDLADTLKTTAVEPGRGIIGSLIASGQPEFVNDSAADARAIPIPGTPLQHDERLMVVPLMAGTEVQGAMAVWRTGGSPFESRDLEFLVGLSQQAVIALKNARLFDETRASLERQTATAEVLQVISGSMADRSRCSTASWPAPRNCSTPTSGAIYLVGDDGHGARGRRARRIQGAHRGACSRSRSRARQPSMAIEQGHVMSFPDVVHGAGRSPRAAQTWPGASRRITRWPRRR